MPFADSLYLGLPHGYDNKEIGHPADDYNATLEKVKMEDVVKLMCEKNIVAMFLRTFVKQDPRALGNRSLMYDPTDPNGKDVSTKSKGREYPFAGTILAEHAEEWFDMRGMKDSTLHDVCNGLSTQV